MASNPTTVDSVPMLDLRSEAEGLWPDLSGAVERVLRSGQYVMGSEVSAFEEAIAGYLGVKHAVALNSGTDALVIGLRAAGVRPGDEVITTPFTFFATVEAIALVGAAPVFVDIEPDSFNIDVEAIDAAITPKTRAVLPVHVFGDPVRMASLMEIARRHELLVIEDCAQAFGATFDAVRTDPASGIDAGPARRRVGSAGHVAAFSFYPTKNLGAYGDGGLVATSDDAIAAQARSLRVHASDPTERYVHRGIGYNSRLDELQAAILRVKLPHVDAWNRLRREAAGRYDSLFAEIEGVITPPRSLGHVYHQYTIRVARDARDRVRRALTEARIASSVFYPSPVEAWPQALAPRRGSAPRTEAAASEVLSLPMHPRLTFEEQQRVALVVQGAL